MTPKQFLLVGGIVLVVVGILGFIGVTGPTPEQSIFGEAWWFDNGENWAHLIIGVVGVIAAYALSANLQKLLVMVLGIIGVLVGLYSLFNQSFLGSNLQNPADTLLHLVVGAWALYASMGKGAGSMSTPPMPGM
jgi:hypothetical protein